MFRLQKFPVFVFSFFPRLICLFSYIEQLIKLSTQFGISHNKIKVVLLFNLQSLPGNVLRSTNGVLIDEINLILSFKPFDESGRIRKKEKKSQIEILVTSACHNVMSLLMCSLLTFHGFHSGKKLVLRT